MECEQIKTLFLDYHDGVIDDADRAAVEAHLKDCDSCQAEWRAYRTTMNEISGLNLLQPDDGFEQRVKKTMSRRSKGRFFGANQSHSLKFAIVSFVLIVLIVCAYYYFTASTEIKLLDTPSDGPTAQDTQGPSPSSPR